MVSAVGNEPHVLAMDKKGLHQGYVWKVRATQEGVIENHLVVWLPGEGFDDIPHGESHAAQMNGHVGRLRKERTLSIKECAREIQTVFDIGGARGGAQHRRHFIANRTESSNHQTERHGR